jgi:putative alpha-1,2-mannosidase
VDKAVLTIGAPYPPATFTMVAKNQSPANTYIQSATRNGRRLAEPRIRQKEIVAGGTLEFVMGDKPNPAAFH